MTTIKHSDLHQTSVVRDAWVTYAIGLVAVAAALLGAILPMTLVAVLVGAACLTLIAARAAAARQQFLYSPIGLLFVFLVANCVLPPVFWDLKLATPWVEVVSTSGIVKAGIFAMILATIAIWLAINPSAEVMVTIVRCEEHRLQALLVVSGGLGLLGLVGVSALAGGFESLVTTLTTRRLVLQSTGPLLILITLPAVTVVLGLLGRRSSHVTHALILLDALIYMFSCLSMGNRFQALVVVVAGLAAYARRVRVKDRWVVIGLLPVIPLSVLYLYRIRQGLSYGVAYGQISTASLHELLYSFVSPFVQGGLDVLRTLDAVFYTSPFVDFRAETILGSVLGVVPRAIWQDKPRGSSIAFSAEHFPTSWASGTGVPPSFPAEMIYILGFGGGLAVFCCAAFALTKISQRMVGLGSLFGLLLLPFAAADSIVLLKSGFDSFFKLIVIHALSVGAVALFFRSYTTLHRVAGWDESRNDKREDLV